MRLSPGGRLLLRRQTSKPIVTDGKLLGEIDQLRLTLRMAKDAERYNSKGLADESPRLEKELHELAAKAAESALVVTVQALPAEVFDDIARRHPPTPAQLDKWREQAKVFPLAEMPEWDDKGMAPDLLEACLIEPEWSEKWWRELSRGIQNQLWNLAIGIQVAGADLPFYNAVTDMTSGGGGQLTSAANGEFPSRSS
jgi:hypothetical protein